MGRKEDSGASVPAGGGWAWGVCWLMFAATMLTYMDRQTVAFLGEPIEAEFGIKAKGDFGWIVSAFMLTYALFQVPAGYLVDRWNLRWTYAAAVAWWSLAAAATAIVPSLGALIACRALLGMGESFNWPTALRVTARILPPSDRSLGNGIFNSGAAIGAVITPVVVTILTAKYGWRSSFAVLGLAGLVWVAAWLFLVRGEMRRLLARPGRQPTPADPLEQGPMRPRLAGSVAAGFGAVLPASVVLALVGYHYYGRTALWLGVAAAIVGPLLLAAIVPRERLEGAAWSASLGDIVRNRRFWIMAIVSISINICWHFLVTWIPNYLKDERKMAFEAGNYASTIPFLAADAGNLLGGWLSRRLAATGRSAARARLLVMVGATPMIMAGLAISLATNVPAAVVLLSIIAAGTAAFMVNYFSFTQEVTVRHTGLVVGYLGAFGNLFAAGFQPFAGAVKDLTDSYSPVFAIIGVAPLIGLAALFAGWGVSRQPDAGAE